MPRDTLVEVLEIWTRAAREKVWTTLPVVVVKVDAAAGLVDVQPVVREPSRDSNGDYDYMDLPVIPVVPICWQQGGGFVLTFPISEGDHGLLHVSMLDASNWEDSGEISDPPTNGRHNIRSCFFVPGVRPLTEPYDPTDLTARQAGVVLGKDGGLQLHVTDSLIELGAATDFVALASKTAAAFAAIRDVFKAWTPSAGDGGLALKTAMASVFGGPSLATWPTDVAASKVKAE